MSYDKRRCSSCQDIHRGAAFVMVGYTILILLTVNTIGLHAAGNTYLGCFTNDDHLMRNTEADIGGIGLFADDAEVLVKCSVPCHTNNKAVFGLLRNGPAAGYVQCFCGNSQPAAALTDRECSYICNRWGSSKYECGGHSNAISVYTDVNECETSPDPCDSGHTCANTLGSYTCDCAPGYSQTVAAQPACEDVNECIGVNPCPDNMKCSNIAGNYTCTACDTGYQVDPNDSTHCADVNECIGANPCAENMKCTNIAGNYTCTACDTGYQVDPNDSTNCAEIDECQDRSLCGDGGSCINTPGSYSCDCNTGYSQDIDIPVCEDIDECALNKDGCNQTCENTDGSYKCSCDQEGYVTDPDSNHICILADTSGLGIPVIAGAAAGGAAVVIAAVIVAVILVLRRRKNKPAAAQSQSTVVFIDNQVNTSETNDATNSAFNGLEHAKQTDKHPEVPEKKPVIKVDETTAPEEAVYQNSTLVTCEDFPGYVQLRRKESIPYKDEYKALPDQTSECKDAKRDGVKSKNRFKNMYPYDNNRVKLMILNDDPSTDYVNASYINGYGSKEKYIASSGPTKATVEDFWRMVLEKDVQLIVMLTRLKEARSEKCLQYWPEEKSVQFGKYQILSTKEDVWPDYIIRKFKVTDGSSSHFVNHLQYMSWPDHGVPSDATALMNFRRRVARTMVPNKYTVIHCSAGVGRTGTLIALDYLLRQAEADNKVDVMECVTKLRHQRVYMVQTQEQYAFIHNALCLRFTVGETMIPSAGFTTSILPMKVKTKKKKVPTATLR